jgi:hypothetical protein
MLNAARNVPAAPVISTSLGEKLLNIFVCPGDVFDEVIAGPTRLANWRVPTLLAGLAGMILFQATTTNQTAAVQLLSGAATLPPEQREMLSGAWPLVSSLTVCFAAFAGTIWSAFVLWFIGRIFLKVRFSYLKALEVVGLTGIILVLGTVVTVLLISVSGKVTARPSLSWVGGNANPGLRVGRLLDTLNVFHLWTTTVLAIGLSRLGGVSFKEASFWVFGYWLFARIALIILG